VADKEEKLETVTSRAKTEAGNDQVANLKAGDDSESLTVTDVSDELKAMLQSKQANRPSITGPTELPTARQLAKNLSKCIVPRISADYAENARRSGSSAQYMSDFIKILLRMGAPHFQLAHQYPFLVGVGMIGQLDNIPRSTRDNTTREVFIEDIDAKASQTPIIASRVWPLIDTQNAMTPPGISLGRSNINDVVITEYALSKSHCRFNLEEDDKTYVLRDLGSTNGTHLNGVLLKQNEPEVVKHFDIIVLGRYQFQYFSAQGFLQELIGIETAPS